MTKTLRTPLVYSAMVILMVTTVNLLTSPGFLWFVFPAFGVAWWPLSVYFAGKKQAFKYSVCGTALIAGLLAITYLIASPGAHPWFLYPVLAVLWWPLSVWGAKKGARTFSVAGGLYVIITFLLINLLTSPSFWWWVYPAFFTLWWPVSVLMGDRAKTLSYAVCSAVAASLFLLIMHRVHTPGAQPWYLYALLPFFWWSVSRVLAPRVDGLRFTLISVIVFAAYYTGLAALLYGVSSALFPFLLFGAAWLLYAMGISRHRNSLPFAAVNAALLGVFFFLVHRLITPDVHTWYWYTFFPLVWWPVTAALKEKAVKPPYVIAGAAAFLAYYGALNLWLSPATPWILFLTFPAAGAALGSIIRQNKSYRWFSVLMAAAGIAYFAAINLVYTPHTVWAVYPAFGLLWWPLSVWLYTRRKEE
ncbi:MAG: hypothetical protein ABIK64_02020 [Bacillota bacterium]